MDGRKPPTIPAKFLPTPITNELESQYQRRLQLSVEKMKCEAETMKIRSDHQRRMYETVDREIMEEIEIKFENDPETQTKLKDLWISDCQEQEKISQNSWNEKEDFFKNLELDDTEEMDTRDDRSTKRSQVQHKKNNIPNQFKVPGQHSGKVVGKKTSYLKEKNTSQGNRNRRFQQEGANYNRNQYGFGNCSYRNQQDSIETENERYEYEPSLQHTQSDSFLPTGRPPNNPF